jgi:hypothetical protein
MTGKNRERRGPVEERDRRETYERERRGTGRNIRRAR